MCPGQFWRTAQRKWHRRHHRLGSPLRWFRSLITIAIFHLCVRTCSRPSSQPPSLLFHHQLRSFHLLTRSGFRRVFAVTSQTSGLFIPHISLWNDCLLWLERFFRNIFLLNPRNHHLKCAHLWLNFSIMFFYSNMLCTTCSGKFSSFRIKIHGLVIVHLFYCLKWGDFDFR